MVISVDEIKKTTIKLFGQRKTADKRCVFCGEYLGDDKYCTCRESTQINIVAKRVNKMLYDMAAYGTDSEIIRGKLVAADVPAKFKGFDFSAYHTACSGQEKVLKAVIDYRDNALENFLKGKNLLLIGNFGTGKTMLMSILCEDLVYKYGFNCRYFNAVGLLYKMKSSFEIKSKKTFTELLAEYKKPDFLFIDDIDKLNPTDFIKEFMYGLVNYRIENKKPIIISANSSLEVLDTNYFGEAVVSRLIEHSREIIFDLKNMRYEQ